MTSLAPTFLPLDAGSRLRFLETSLELLLPLCLPIGLPDLHPPFQRHSASRNDGNDGVFTLRITADFVRVAGVLMS